MIISGDDVDEIKSFKYLGIFFFYKRIGFSTTM